MLLGYHPATSARCARQNDVLDALRGFNLSPGDYCCRGPARRPSPLAGVRRRGRQGSGGDDDRHARGGMSMGRNLALWFVYTLIVGLFAG